MKEDQDLEKILKDIAGEHSIIVNQWEAIGGGDICEVFLITAPKKDKYILKLIDAAGIPDMFPREMNSLKALKETGCIDIPEPLASGEFGNHSYLLLEHRPEGKAKVDFWEKFGEQLACLHQNSNKEFGFFEDNYIGSLLQRNTWTRQAPDFYINQRLKPQLELAEHYELNISEDFLENIAENIPDEAPSLIHGDLWNGNFLINAEGAPCLFDPAVAYAPREMDLAMMKLFGGFDRKLFDAYNEHLPLERGFEDRLPLWQLYYLLVHLNIFGKGYRNQVVNIIKKYN